MSRKFELEHRIGADECAQSARELQNRSIDDYYLFNAYSTNSADCKAEEEKVRAFMSANHISYRDGYGFANQCHVDDDSKIRMGQEMTHDRSRTQLFTRTFQAVPNFARGGLIPNVESRLVQGDQVSDKRACDVLAEVNYNRNVPLLECLKGNVQNPDHIVPMWTWGGDPTRDTVRQAQFLENNGYQFDGSIWTKKMA